MSQIVEDMVGQLYRDEEELARLRDENERLKAQVAALEMLRPHWAMGYSDESVAAQVANSALAQLWARLGAVDQTDAIQKIEKLVR